MPGSFSHFDGLLGDRLAFDFPRDVRVLDVGAGAGKYRELLWDFAHVDAVEPHEPYVGQFKLRERYEHVLAVDVREVGDQLGLYDLIIFGDVLEHLPVADAQALLERVAAFRETATLVVVPYRYEQDAVDGVEWERHHQPDLTHDLFMARFPGFECLARDEVYGAYVRDPLNRWRCKDLPPGPADASVLIGMPTVNWRNTVTTTMTLFKMQHHHMANGLADLHLQIEDSALVETSRNRIVSVCRGNLGQWTPSPTHVLFIDSDQGMAPDALARLLSHRVQIIGVPTRKRKAEMAWNTRPTTDGKLRWNGCAAMTGGIGTGILLIAKTCLDRMAEDARELQSDADGFIYREVFRNGVESEDLDFSTRWIEKGGRVWADPSIASSHVGMYDYAGRLADHLEHSPPR